jgi:hypothetical protein
MYAWLEFMCEKLLAYLPFDKNKVFVFSNECHCCCSSLCSGRANFTILSVPQDRRDFIIAMFLTGKPTKNLMLLLKVKTEQVPCYSLYLGNLSGVKYGVSYAAVRSTNVEREYYFSVGTAIRLQGRHCEGEKYRGSSKNNLFEFI